MRMASMSMPCAIILSHGPASCAPLAPICNGLPEDKNSLTKEGGILVRTITNDYRDAQILNLGSTGQRGPYLVTQTGVAPRAELPRTRMFVLRPDGKWADFNAYASQNKPEALDEIVFSTMGDVVAL